MALSLEDWRTFTVNDQLCDEQAGLSVSGFHTAIRFQLALFSHRLVANKMQLAASEDNENTAVLFALKMVMMSVFHKEWNGEVITQAPLTLNANIKAEDNVYQGEGYKDAPRHAAVQATDGQGRNEGQVEGGCGGGGGENRIMTKLAQIQEDMRRQHELSEQRYARIEAILSTMQVLNKTVI